MKVIALKHEIDENGKVIFSIKGEAREITEDEKKEYIKKIEASERQNNFLRRNAVVDKKRLALRFQG